MDSERMPNHGRRGKLLATHKAYFDAWNDAFQTKDPSQVLAYISSYYRGHVGYTGNLEYLDATGNRQGCESAIQSTNGRWDIAVKDVEFRGPHDAVIAYRATLSWPGGSMTKLVR